MLNLGPDQGKLHHHVDRIGGFPSTLCTLHHSDVGLRGTRRPFFSSFVCCLLMFRPLDSDVLVQASGPLCITPWRGHLPKAPMSTQATAFFSFGLLSVCVRVAASKQPYSCAAGGRAACGISRHAHSPSSGMFLSCCYSPRAGDLYLHEGPWNLGTPDVL